jgi:hypothetical protein
MFLKVERRLRLTLAVLYGYLILSTGAERIANRTDRDFLKEMKKHAG